MTTIATIVSRLKELQPLLKEAVAQTQTSLDILTSTKPEDQEAIRLTLNHITERITGKAERSDEEAYKLAEIINDSLEAMQKLDEMWNLEDGRITFTDTSISLKPPSEKFAEFVTAAIGARNRLFVIKLAISKDASGETSKFMISTLLKSVAALSLSYCDIVIDSLKDLDVF